MSQASFQLLWGVRRPGGLPRALNPSTICYTLAIPAFNPTAIYDTLEVWDRQSVANSVPIGWRDRRSGANSVRIEWRGCPEHFRYTIRTLFVTFPQIKVTNVTCFCGFGTSRRLFGTRVSQSALVFRCVSLVFWCGLTIPVLNPDIICYLF